MPLILLRTSGLRTVLLLLGLLFSSSELFGQQAPASNATAPLPADPTLHWDFETTDPQNYRVIGSVNLDSDGPRGPLHTRHLSTNRAVLFSAQGYLEVKDPGPDSRYDFSTGDNITIEAWVRPSNTGNGQQQYIIGKGRSGKAAFQANNQNWALRIVKTAGTIRLSFLFASRDAAGNSSWHRWVSDLGFPPASGWHHLAVTYSFGSAKSITGWIDGIETTGTWDMAGATDRAPIVDNDSIYIGSSQNGNTGNSFLGTVDEIRLHRARFTTEQALARFDREGGSIIVKPEPPRMPEIQLPDPQRVQFSIHQGLDSHEQWPFNEQSVPAPTATWSSTELLLPRLPQAYDSWGIRNAWQAPVMLRAAADVELPAGEYRILLRARQLGRLWVNGQQVTDTTVNKRRRINLEPIVPIPKPSVPDARVTPFAQQDAVGTFTIEATDTDTSGTSTARVVLELMVGGKQQRTETGEVCVAIASMNQPWFDVLRPANQPVLPLTNAQVIPALQAIETQLTEFDDDRRRNQYASSQDSYWQDRHQFARQVVDSRRQLAADSAPPTFAQWSEHQSQTPLSLHPIDRLITEKINRFQSASTSSTKSAVTDDAASAAFYQTIFPILENKCNRCHGTKAKGGLRLDQRAAALKGGESEVPAIVPGHPEQSELLIQIKDGAMPPESESLNQQEVAILETWIRQGAKWPRQPLVNVTLPEKPLPVIDDAAFLRRAYIDILGLPPTAEALQDFVADQDPDKRHRVIDRLLASPGFADNWISVWLDLLAENPTLLNQSLNSTGPFRWFLYDALKDNKGLDRMVSELIMMRGDAAQGGSAGFAMAAENDSPMAAKAHILASSFLGVDLQCARCHDSPFHRTTQADLFSLAAMLSRKPITPPDSSRVPDAFFESLGQRKPLIEVTLAPGVAVQPTWSLEEQTLVDDSVLNGMKLRDPKDSRERLAALITSPQNDRFAKVIANQVWQRLIGIGIVEPINDWEGNAASHPELLAWLADELVANHYDLRHLVRVIMNSRVYQQQPLDTVDELPPEQRFFAGPAARRMTAEQVVDSLFAVTGQSMDVEELTFVHDGVHPLKNRLTLGTPTRAWMFASLNNERDRPSLSLPRAQVIADVLLAFGWKGSRQMPVVSREAKPNVLQPGILANGVLSQNLTRAAAGSSLADLAVNSESPQQLIQQLYTTLLSRPPSPEEESRFVNILSTHFADRLVPREKVRWPIPERALPQVTWTNHLVPQANEIQLEVDAHVRRGPAPDPRLTTEWREVYEDFVWSLINSPEFVWVP